MGYDILQTCPCNRTAWGTPFSCGELLAGIALLPLSVPAPRRPSRRRPPRKSRRQARKRPRPSCPSPTALSLEPAKFELHGHRGALQLVATGHYCLEPRARSDGRSEVRLLRSENRPRRRFRPSFPWPTGPRPSSPCLATARRRPPCRERDGEPRLRRASRTKPSPR